MKLRFWSPALFAAVAATSNAVVLGYGFDGNLNGVAAGGGVATMTALPGTNDVSTFGITQGPSQIEQAVSNLPDGPGGFVHHTAYPNGGNGGYGIDFAAGTFGPNGPGDIFVNNYTFMVDLFLPGTTGEWFALFNTEPDQSNDADWYVSPTNQLGIGELGYTADNVVTRNAWNRLAFVSDASNNYVRYFVNGTQVFDGPGILANGRFSLYTNIHEGNDFAFMGEGDSSGNYSGTGYVNNLILADFAMTNAQIAAYGGPSRFNPVPEPASLFAIALGIAALRRRSK